MTRPYKNAQWSPQESVGVHGACRWTCASLVYLLDYLCVSCLRNISIDLNATWMHFRTQEVMKILLDLRFSIARMSKWLEVSICTLWRRNETQKKMTKMQSPRLSIFSYNWLPSSSEPVLKTLSTLVSLASLAGSLDVGKLGWQFGLVEIDEL